MLVYRNDWEKFLGLTRRSNSRKLADILHFLCSFSDIIVIWLNYFLTFLNFPKREIFRNFHVQSAGLVGQYNQKDSLYESEISKQKFEIFAEL